MIVNTLFHSEKLKTIWMVFFQNKSASAAIAILEDNPKEAFLCDMWAQKPRLGHGSALLKEIESYCQKNQIHLIVEAIWYEGEPGSIVGAEDLQKFYEKNGAKFTHMGKYGPTLEMGYIRV